MVCGTRVRRNDDPHSCFLARTIKPGLTNAPTELTNPCKTFHQINFNFKSTTIHCGKIKKQRVDFKITFPLLLFCRGVCFTNKCAGIPAYR